MRRPRLAAAIAVALLVALGCRGDRAPAAAGEARRYSVRGEVVRLPAADGRELLIRHEAIPDFVDHQGKTVGMDSMTMPFPVDPSVSLGGVAVGDKVRFRFRMDWTKNAYAVESIEVLPAGTSLELGADAKRQQEAGPAR